MGGAERTRPTRLVINFVHVYICTRYDRERMTDWYKYIRAKACSTYAAADLYVQSESFRVLTPLQVGVGVQAGCESIVHALARVQEDSDIPPEDRWTLLWISPMLLTVSTGSICSRR